MSDSLPIIAAIAVLVAIAALAVMAIVLWRSRSERRPERGRSWTN